MKLQRFFAFAFATILLLSAVTPYISVPYLPGVNATSDTNQTKIPSWIKNNAKWWSEGQIGDSDFTKGLQYLMDNGIMVIPTTASAGNAASHGIPSWIKNNAGWWATGQISDGEFVKGMQYLVGNGIINAASTPNTSTTTSALPQIEMEEYNNTYYHFIVTLPAGPTGDFVVTILPNQKYTPSSGELNGSAGLSIYGVQYTHSKIDNAFTSTLSYFLPYSALPPDVVSSLNSPQTRPSSIQESGIPRILLAVLSPNTSHLVYADGGAVNGAHVVVESIHHELMKVGSKELEKLLSPTAIMKKHGAAGTETLSAVKDVVGAYLIKTEYDKWKQELTDAEDCVKQQLSSGNLLHQEIPGIELDSIDETSGAVNVDTTARYIIAVWSVGLSEFSMVATPSAELASDSIKQWDEKYVQDLINSIRPCGPPENLQASGGDSKVFLSWQPPSKKSLTPIARYYIYRGESPGGEIGIKSTTDTSYWDYSVTNGHTYWYYVTAVNKGGESPPSNSANTAQTVAYHELHLSPSLSNDVGLQSSNEASATPSGKGNAYFEYTLSNHYDFPTEVCNMCHYEESVTIRGSFTLHNEGGVLFTVAEELPVLKYESLYTVEDIQHSQGSTTAFVNKRQQESADLTVSASPYMPYSNPGLPDFNSEKKSITVSVAPSLGSIKNDCFEKYDDQTFDCSSTPSSDLSMSCVFKEIDPTHVGTYVGEPPYGSFGYPPGDEKAVNQKASCTLTYTP